ncbi:D-alanyl-D-alanine carboxypeptidase [Brevibacillus reuszeri]|uniref:serine-type D-Ala-D-Ala carboxypeptidase n=2 Tax=Brevibacillus reuszeri TaxID=54915 RepID=A0ABQ0TPT0_9BACL|nr:D-alanyl-D-alanine carboxypeptidase family protein [Brevibacillus reuszeri]MED1861310.1 D-alanyl-D-alanine carboxypeptidase [Brevibacillus reuszeri]GED69851.1 D-alanyl-D-alanine carboxypeptidase [Brevibacillus reuszeri]
MRENKEGSKTFKRKYAKGRDYFISFMILLCLFVIPVSAFAEAAKIPSIQSVNLELRSAVLVEPVTGQVLLSINADQAYAPASMTKMMTGYIIADKVKKGAISWNDVVTVKENASQTIGSRAYLALGETHTVQELFTVMLVHSANDAAVALAEYVSGSEQQFVTEMNEEAKRLGMEKSYYINVSGLDRTDMPLPFRPQEQGENVMSAMDVATLVKSIFQDHPEMLEVTSMPSYQFRATDREPFVNTNWMLESNKDSQYKKYAYEGLDGLKTGFTDSAGYCFASTAERDGMRLISVVMGTKSMSKRFTETKKVLDYGFDHFELKQVVAAKSTPKGMEMVLVKSGTKTEVPVLTEQAVSFLVPKGSDASQLSYQTNFVPQELTAPFAAGAKAGTITYTYQIEGKDMIQEKTVNMVAADEVEKAGWVRLLFRSIWEVVSGLF